MCLSPIFKKGRFRDGSGDRFVPCGYCSECVRKKKLDWQIRLDSARNWASCSFFRLLTYDPEHYDFDIYDKEIIKDHIQRFLKRLRRHFEYHYGKSVRLKYFIASEYGETYDRLHYHCLFFIKGIKLTWLEFGHIVRKVWPYGIVGNTYNLNSQRCAYAVKYIQKQYNTKFYSRFEIGVVAPDLERRFRVQKRYSVYDKSNLPCYVFNGKRVSLPYYWMRKLFTNDEICHFRDNVRIIHESKSLSAYMHEYDAKMSRQHEFDYENSVGFKVPEHRFENNDDISPNLDFYVSNL